MLELVLYIGAFMLLCGGVVPFLWFFWPDSRAGFASSKEAEEWGRYCLVRNKRIAPQICATHENDPSWR